MVSWECNHSPTPAVGGISSAFPARSFLSPSSCWQMLLRYSSPGRSPSFVEVGAGWAPLGRAVTAELSPHPGIKFRGTGDSPSSAPAPELRSSHAAREEKAGAEALDLHLQRDGRRVRHDPRAPACSPYAGRRDTRKERVTRRRRQAGSALRHCPGTAKGRAPPGTRALPPPATGQPRGSRERGRASLPAPPPPRASCPPGARPTWSEASASLL